MAEPVVPAQVDRGIEVSEVGATLVLRLRGELDTASRDTLTPALDHAITHAHAVVIDLADLTFCDSTGIAMLLAGSREAKAQGVSMSIRNPAPLVRRVFEITRLDAELPVAPPAN